jgi:hypothetical protein
MSKDGQDMASNGAALGGGRRFGRIAGVLVAAAVAVVLIVSSTSASSRALGGHLSSDGAHPGCNGIANAHSRVIANASAENRMQRALDALASVAQKHGCDLTEVRPAEHSNRGNGDDVEAAGDDADERHGPPAEVVARKCDRIQDKLDRAQGREHGHSADAFARQAEKWSCPS